MSRIIIAGVLAIVLIGFGLGLYAWVMDKGADLERAKQEKENAEFVIRANKGRSTYDQCDTANGLYDFRTSTCKLPTARGDSRAAPGSPREN